MSRPVWMALGAVAAVGLAGELRRRSGGRSKRHYEAADGIIVVVQARTLGQGRGWYVHYEAFFASTSDEEQALAWADEVRQFVSERVPEHAKPSWPGALEAPVRVELRVMRFERTPWGGGTSSDDLLPREDPCTVLATFDEPYVAENFLVDVEHEWKNQRASLRDLTRRGGRSVWLPDPDQRYAIEIWPWSRADGMVWNDDVFTFGTTDDLDEARKAMRKLVEVVRSAAPAFGIAPDLPADQAPVYLDVVVYGSRPIDQENDALPDAIQSVSIGAVPDGLERARQFMQSLFEKWAPRKSLRDLRRKP